MGAQTETAATARLIRAAEQGVWMEPCLTETELAGAVNAELSIGERERVLRHVDSCAACRSKLNGMTRRRGPDAAPQSGEFFARTLRRDERAPSGAPTMVIEGYEVLGEIHRGGQGVVYKAVQRSTSRTVALKVLPHEEIASVRQKHRFEREVSLAANLRHPNIVTVYDSGLTSGRYFFAMEYIHGKPLDEYLRSAELTVDAKLRLFATIASAISYAHIQGVIHRDLKPGNILVDSLGEPHVVDFGLAKTAPGAVHFSALQQADGVPMTLTSQFMGTLAYASPEQTKGDPSLVDARSDIYSLGVILFEMLTGKYPYPLPADLVGAFKSICEHEPARPSSLVKPSGGAREIDGDVDTIVLRVLAKEPARRYQTVAELRDDVERYLAGEPIAARRDSMAYVLKMRGRTLVDRHRMLAMLAVVVLACLLSMIILPALSELWPAPQNRYERMVTNLLPQPAPAGVFENVRIIAITDETTDRVEALAAALGVEGVRKDQWRTVRSLHGWLMKQLAGSNLRALVWDIGFAGPDADDPQRAEITRANARFVEGVKAMQKAGVNPVLGSEQWKLEKQLDGAVVPVGIAPEIVAAGVRWGGVTMMADDSMPWRIDLVVARGGRLMLGLPLTTVSEFEHPTMDIGADLDLTKEALVLRYYPQVQMRWQPAALAASEYLTLTSARPLHSPTKDDLLSGLERGDIIGNYVLDLPSTDVLENVTYAYHDVFLASPEKLRDMFEGKLVLIGDFRRELDQPDWHPTPDGRELAGPHAHAITMDMLLRSAVVARYPRGAGYAAALALGALAGLIAAHASSSRTKRAAMLLGAAALMVTVSLVGYWLFQYLLYPVVPAMAMLLVFAGAIFIDRLHGPVHEVHALRRSTA